MHQLLNQVTKSEMSYKKRQIFPHHCTSPFKVVLLGAGDRVAGLPLLRQQPGTATCRAPPKSLLPQWHWVGWQRHGDELSGCQEHRSAGLPPLEQTDGHGGPEGSDAQDQDWTMTCSTESQKMLYQSEVAQCKCVRAGKRKVFLGNCD